jgi:CDP-diacylglycerol--glycerol-3-phosphate 3-phosphatidyltransferase
MSVSEGQKFAEMKAPARVYTIPNLLSITRGLLGPVVMWMITSESPGMLAWALMLMVLAELSDFVDGVVARRFKQQSELGRVIDPICDSIYHLSIFLAFLSRGWMPAWMLFIIYARDLTVPYIRTIARQAGHELEIRDSGKLKTLVHAVAQIGVVLVGLEVIASVVVAEINTMQVLMVAATAASLYSLADYTVAAARAPRR